jgi:hypothetical protein
MGWLFAVALGLQERRRGAVIRARGPIALGHALSVAGAVALVALAQLWIDLGVVKAVGAVALVVLGIHKLVAPLSHPRWVGMRVNGRDLVLWSLLMSSAHGAGLMLVPVLLRLSPDRAGHPAHANELVQISSDASTALWGAELAAIGIHSVAMLAIMALIAVLVFEKVGLAVLRRAWFNLDRLWAGALIAAAWITLLI